MRDVAALAGVGLKTVSRVINGESKVAPETAARVIRAANQLDYQPDFYAGTLKRTDRRTRTLGLVVGNIANPFSGSVGRAVEDVATRHGSAVLTSSLDDDPEREEQLIANLLRRRVDSLILTTARSDQSYLVREQERGTGLVFVDRAPAGIVADVVVTDNADASATAVRHLMDHGHHRIAYLGDRPQLWTAQERLRGFRVAAPSHPIVDEDVEDEDEAVIAVERLFDQPEPPTALFTAQNLITIGAIRALRRLGLSSRVALVGFDDIPLGDLVEPAVTVMRQDPYAIGERAAELAFARHATPTLAPATYVIPSTLVVRGSGEIPPQLS